MQANLVNMLAIFIGCSLGRLAGRFMDKKLEDFLMTAMGLAVLYLGIDMALKTQTDLVVILSLVLGGILGTKLKLEDRLYARGNKLQAKLAKEGGPNFATGFIGASLLFLYRVYVHCRVSPSGPGKKLRHPLCQGHLGWNHLCGPGKHPGAGSLWVPADCGTLPGSHCGFFKIH